MYALGALAIMAAACVEQQSVKSPPVPVDTPQARAEKLLQSGQFHQAATAFADLGTSTAGPEATDYLLRAALLFADLGDLPRALALPPAAAESNEGPRRTLVDAIKLVQSGAPEKALFNLNALDTSALTPFEKGLFLRELGRLQQANRDPAALLNLANAELFPMPANRRTELSHLIWDGLRVARDPSIRDKLDPRNPNLTGWLALLDGYLQHSANPAALATQLAAWRQQFPGHPANEMLVEEILEFAEEQSAPIQRVALMLPLDGELAGYGRAVRDGYLATRFASNDWSLNVRMYSASGASVVGVYQQAVKEGAQLVVGPLDKPGIEALAALPEHPVPMLALNNIGRTPIPDPAAAVPRFTQYGLAPEDEGEDLANRAWHDGHRRMAYIVPGSDIGTRIKTSFEKKWAELGGSLVNAATYGNSVSAYKAAIRETFSLAQSEARAAHLRRLLSRPVVFFSRPRPDLDAIMLVADPVAARQIIPQFRYLGVDHLPIYATSQVFSGRVNPAADQDLDSVIFGAMPWSLGARDTDLAQTMRRHWSSFSVSEQTLFAFGVDAYRLTKSLGGLARDQTQQLNGATGELRRDPEGRIRRALTWAQFRGGIPRLLTAH